MLFRPINNSLKLVATYNGNFTPFKNENEIYYINPFEFSSNPSRYINQFFNDIPNRTQIINNSLVDIDKYFHLQGEAQDYLDIYAASYLSETIIKDVPNYMNTQYNNMGCVPTTAAMYFAFMEDNGYPTLVPNSFRNLPLRHTTDRNKVDAFIKYLGDNYFNTTTSGTYVSNIVPAYNNYLDDMNFSNYEAHVTTSYNEYCNAISNAANPVDVCLYGHEVLGIGYRQIHNSDGSHDRFIICNYIANNAMEVSTIALDTIRQFIPIYY